ncbi:MAG: methionine-R-sulfoxide reductase [bacterium]|nr:methionine-R-sulfoxide reductase [bacterium]
MNKLTGEEARILIDKETEAPFIGEYDDFYLPGTYLCKQCDSPLFSSKSKFDARCGWPAFDDNFPDAITRTKDADGLRVEITCTNCSGHLGHVFEGEKLTQANTRHCVNSLSIRFVAENEELP